MDYKLKYTDFLTFMFLGMLINPRHSKNIRNRLSLPTATCLYV